MKAIVHLLAESWEKDQYPTGRKFFTLKEVAKIEKAEGHADTVCISTEYGSERLTYYNVISIEVFP